MSRSRRSRSRTRPTRHTSVLAPRSRLVFATERKVPSGAFFPTNDRTACEPPARGSRHDAKGSREGSRAVRPCSRQVDDMLTSVGGSVPAPSLRSRSTNVAVSIATSSRTVALAELASPSTTSCVPAGTSKPKLYSGWSNPTSSGMSGQPSMPWVAMSIEWPPKVNVAVGNAMSPCVSSRRVQGHDERLVRVDRIDRRRLLARAERLPGERPGGNEHHDGHHAGGDALPAGREAIPVRGVGGTIGGVRADPLRGRVHIVEAAEFAFPTLRHGSITSSSPSRSRSRRRPRIRWTRTVGAATPMRAATSETGRSST